MLPGYEQFLLRADIDEAHKLELIAHLGEVASLTVKRFLEQLLATQHWVEASRGCCCARRADRSGASTAAQSPSEARRAAGDASAPAPAPRAGAAGAGGAAVSGARAPARSPRSLLVVLVRPAAAPRSRPAFDPRFPDNDAAHAERCARGSRRRSPRARRRRAARCSLATTHGARAAS